MNKIVNISESVCVTFTIPTSELQELHKYDIPKLRLFIETSLEEAGFQYNGVGYDQEGVYVSFTLRDQFTRLVGKDLILMAISNFYNRLED